MRPRVPSHKTVFVRFHKRIDALLTQFAADTGMRRATAVTWIQNRYMETLLAGGADPAALTAAELGFSGTEEAYFLTVGRRSAGEGSMLGRAMQITVDKNTDRTLSLLAMQNNYAERDFRTAILVKYFEENGYLQ